MNVILFYKVVLILRIGFLYYFARELHLTPFKRRTDKFIWFFVVLVFGIIGYSFYISFRRRLILKRKFQPNFNIYNKKL